ncbi:MAG: hypothetical protein JWM05_1872, partial [Acidimicrobiales bacterium]|nr:hypothetical protein [Acidimicrobiales bacterium]
QRETLVPGTLPSTTATMATTAPAAPAAGRPGGAAPPPLAGTPPAPAGRPVRLVTVGDSVGFELVYLSPRVQGMEMTTGALIGCGVVPDPLDVGGQRQGRDPECVRWLDSWRAMVATDPDVALVVLGAWEVFDSWVDGRRVPVGSREWRTLVARQLRLGLDVLTTGTRVRVGVMTVPCMRPRPVGGSPARSERAEPARVAALNDVLRETTAAYRGRAVLIDYAGFACPGGVFRERVDGVVLRPDGVHVDRTSAVAAWRWLAPIVLDMARRPVL